jgi:hypothetical protein
LQTGAPSSEAAEAGAVGVTAPMMPQLFDVLVLVTFTVQPACVPITGRDCAQRVAGRRGNGPNPPAGLAHEAAVVAIESAKYALGGHQVAQIRLHGGDVRLFFVLANFGIAMAAKMPMITTTISADECKALAVHVIPIENVVINGLCSKWRSANSGARVRKRRTEHAGVA